MVMRVPSYSPHAVAEHAVALILSLNRKIHKTYNRVRDSNFSLEHLVGFDLVNKTVGIIGTGKIGLAFAEIMLGFSCKVIAYVVFPMRHFRGRELAIFHWKRYSNNQIYSHCIANLHLIHIKL
jgi:D-lactate dehydrogenase